MEELIKSVAGKANINADQAKTAVLSVFDFLKDKLPGVGAHLQGLLAGGDGGGAAGVMDKLKGMLGGK